MLAGSLIFAAAKVNDSVSELSLVLRDVRGDFQNTTFDLLRPSVVKMSKL